MSPTTRAEIVVDVGAIRRNVRLLRARVSAARPVQMIAVVKADGYGHGMLEAAHAAREGGAEWIGVATLDEALALRAAGDSGRLLCWLTVPGEDYAGALPADIDLTAYSVAELDEIAAAAVAAGQPARVQLKVDTGLSRGGAQRDSWLEFFRRAADGERAGLWRITGIWSHFACSDEPEHPANDAQEGAFAEALTLAEAAGLRPEIRHLANSAAAILRPSSRLDAVRCGIAIYGLDPAPGVTDDLGLTPAMTVRARLSLIKPIGAGESVSYGHTWTADHATTLGLVPVGYGDGVPRSASNEAEVAVRGKRRLIRGRVCMDQIVVDLGGDLAEPGDEVVLFGTGAHGTPTAQDWAAACDTINYEIVTRIGGRMRRRYVDNEASPTAEPTGGGAS